MVVSEPIKPNQVASERTKRVETTWKTMSIRANSTRDAASTVILSQPHAALTTKDKKNPACKSVSAAFVSKPKSEPSHQRVPQKSP